MKKRLFGLSFTAISITAISLSYALINKNKDFVSNVKADNEYTLTINNGVSVNDGEGIVKSARGTDFTFGFTSYSAGTGKLGTLSQNGTIYNKTLLNSIQRISVNISSGSVDVFYGWKQYSTSEIEYNSTSSLTVSSGTQTVDLSSIDPSYFKVVANSNSVINSVTVVYTCSEASYVPNLRLKVASPTVGGSGQINDSNYVWICTNIEDSSATDWPSYAMTKDGNDWYYDFTNIAVATGGYGYTFVVCDSNTSIDWSYQTETQYFGVGAGQTLLMVSDVNFDNQPAAIQSTYTLNLTINTSGTPSNF